MDEFAENLRKEKFLVPVCTVCKAKSWPPSPFCQKCLSRTVFRKVKTEGILQEFATSFVRDHEGVFGIVDMDGIKIIGSFATDKLQKGMQVKMTRCGIKSGTPFYIFEPSR